MHLLCVGISSEFDPGTITKEKGRVEQRWERRGKDRREGERKKGREQKTKMGERKKGINKKQY